MAVTAKPTAETAALAEAMCDPPNRFYRYRVARWLLPLAMKTPLMPNHITYLHTSIGLLAAWFAAQGTDRGLIAAAVLGELRLILDCLDGVLARAKKVSSPYGRTIDELGDAVAYLALVAGIYLHVRARNPEFPIGVMLLGMVATGGLMAWVTDFFKRRISSALTTGTDGIFDELLAKARRIKNGDRGFVTRFGYLFDWAQVFFLSPISRRDMEARLDRALSDAPESQRRDAASDAEVEHILQSAHEGSRGLRASVHSIGWMSGDNAITLINIGLLTGSLLLTEAFVMVYGLFTMAAGILLCSVFLHGSRRRVESLNR